MSAFAPTYVSLKILVVEQDPDLSLAFDNLLRHDGHEVMRVTCARSAQDAISTNPFDVIFVDTGLSPGGLDRIAREIRDRQDDPALILVSGLAENTDGAALHRYGAEAWLTTPFGAMELRGVVARTFGPRFVARLRERRAAG